jgi:hypothetical protein
MQIRGLRVWISGEDEQVQLRGFEVSEAGKKCVSGHGPGVEEY